MPRLELDISVDRQSTGGGGPDHRAGEPSDPQVSGTLVDSDGRATAFVGWVGLLALLQQAVAAADASPAPGAS